MTQNLKFIALKLRGMAGIFVLIGLLWSFLGAFPKTNIPVNLSEKEKRELIDTNRENVLRIIQTDRKSVV